MDLNAKMKKKEEEVSSLSNVLQRYTGIAVVVSFLELLQKIAL